MKERPRVALVMRPRFEENLNILRYLARFKRYHGDWYVYVDDQGVGARDPEWLLSQGWDGLICKEGADDLFRLARERGIACVDLSDDSTQRDGCPKIRPNNPAIGHLAAEHFIERGYQHFGFCGFENEDWSKERGEGFVEALDLAGKACSVMETDYPGFSAPAWSFAEETEVGKWLATLPKPVGIFSCNDLRAVNLANACFRSGIKVPEEVALIGTNNDTLRCELSTPPLSSIPVDASEYARLAGETLDEMLSTGSHALVRPERLVDPMDVVTRLSTNALAIEDSSIAMALNIIRERACKGLTVEEVAKRAHISRSLLEKRFRVHVGRSPQVEIRATQVLRIKKLLAESEHSLAVIAEMTGFKHPEYMSVVFKRLTGETPSAYRKKSKGLLLIS